MAITERGRGRAQQGGDYRARPSVCTVTRGTNTYYSVTPKNLIKSRRCDNKYKYNKIDIYSERWEFFNANMGLNIQ